MSQRMRISVIKEKYMRNFHKKIACTLTGVMLCGTLMGAVPVLRKMRRNIQIQILRWIR